MLSDKLLRTCESCFRAFCDLQTSQHCSRRHDVMLLRQSLTTPCTRCKFNFKSLNNSPTNKIFAREHCVKLRLRSQRQRTRPHQTLLCHIVSVALSSSSSSSSSVVSRQVSDRKSSCRSQSYDGVKILCTMDTSISTPPHCIHKNHQSCW